VEFIDHDFEGRPAKADCRLFGLYNEALQFGENKITIKNKSDKEIAIERINLGLF